MALVAVAFVAFGMATTSWVVAIHPGLLRVGSFPGPEVGVPVNRAHSPSIPTCLLGCAGTPRSSAPDPGSPGGSPGPGANGSIVIRQANWTLVYEGNVSENFGPRQQLLCSNCPVSVAPGGIFQLKFSLRNLGSHPASIYVTTGYMGCDPPFYLESESPSSPFSIAAGQTVAVTLTLWADGATPGNWTFNGNLGIN